MENIKKRLIVKGMSCAACSAATKRVLLNLDGVEEADVNLLTGIAEVTYDHAKLHEEDLINAVKKAGFSAEIYNSKENKSNNRDDGIETGKSLVSKKAMEDVRVLKVRLIASILFLIPLLCISMGPMILGMHNTAFPSINVLFQFLFLVPILFLNRSFFTSGIPALIKARPNMNSLVALGSIAATGYGIFAFSCMLYGFETGQMQLVHEYAHQIYFESAGTILTLVTVGKYLEAISKGKTGLAIEKLIALVPDKACVQRDGREITVKTEEIVEGDIVIIKPGERIPVDGEVVKGFTSVDESNVTGESIPVYKGEGDLLISASTNISGIINMRAKAVGDDSTMGKIVKLVEQAGNSNVPIAKLADKIAGIFVPAVLLIAIVTFATWKLLGYETGWSLEMAIAVLVISCPCALGLATPVAVMAGIGRGAENGIMIKSGEALQSLAMGDTIIFDKTGTLTEGKPRLVHIDYVVDGIDKKALLRAVYALEIISEHPLAKAVTEYVEEKYVDIEKSEVEEFQSTPGKGVDGIVDSDRFSIGGMDFLREKGCESPEAVMMDEKRRKDGYTTVGVMRNGETVAIFSIEDMIKNGAKELIDDVKTMKLKTVLLTGDNRFVCEKVRNKIGIEEAYYEVKPNEKHEKVDELKRQGDIVIMVGDGINDAPALASADVGMAVGSGTDVAMESADIVLMSGDPSAISVAIKLARVIMRNIKENLFWAFIYNVICIPLAAGCLFIPLGIKLSPMIGSLAMSLSSVCVCLNALRLRKISLR